jgi:hypothetical protein
MCPDQNASIGRLSPVQSRASPNRLVMNGNFELLQDVTGPLIYILLAQRCQIQSDDCDEPYPTARFDRVCERFPERDQIWSSFMEGIKPPVQCPIRAGNYLLRNATWNFDSLIVLPLEGYKWKVTLKFAQGDESNVIVCFNLVAIITESKSKGGKKPKPKSP